MQRRLIKQGSATLTVSLPVQWAKRYSLKAGDEVDVSEREGAIVISSRKSIAPRTASIDVSGLSDRLVYRTMNAAYIRGVEEIEVIFDRPEQLDVIQRIADSLLGYTIIRHGKDSCTIKDISGVKPEEFDNILRRTFLLVLSISEDTLEALRKKDKNMLLGIPHRDWGVNKLAYACLRILNMHGHQKYNDTTSIYNLVWTLEEISDEYQSLARDAAEGRDIKLSQKSLKQLQILNELLRKVYELYYKYDKKGIIEFYSAKEDLKESIAQIDPSGPLEIKAITYFERLFELLTDITQQILAIQI